MGRRRGQQQGSWFRTHLRPSHPPVHPGCHSKAVELCSTATNLYLIEYGVLQHENPHFVKTLLSLNRKLRKQSTKHLLTRYGLEQAYVQEGNYDSVIQNVAMSGTPSLRLLQQTSVIPEIAQAFWCVTTTLFCALYGEVGLKGYAE